MGEGSGIERIERVIQLRTNLTELQICISSHDPGRLEMYERELENAVRSLCMQFSSTPGVKDILGRVGVVKDV